MRSLLVVIVIAAALARNAGAVLTGAGPQPPSASYRPIDLTWSETGHFHWVTVTVEGKVLALMIDTGGAANIFIDGAAAKGAGIQSIGGTRIIGFSGATREAAVGLCERFDIGPVRCRRQLVYMVDCTEWSNTIEKQAGVRLHGAIGAPLLKRYGGVLDYRKHKLYLDNLDEIELNRMQGYWRAKEVVIAGEKVINRAWLDACRLDIRDDLMTLTSGGFTHCGRFSQFTDRPAHAFQFFTYKKNGIPHPPVVVGLYRATQDTLEVAMPVTKPATYETLPKRLESTSDNGLCVWTFVRHPLPVAPHPREKQVDRPRHAPPPDARKADT